MRTAAVTTYPTFIDITPSARRLSTSLRDIGYDLATAMADLVDNSISAGATTVEIVFNFDAEGSWVAIADNGAGMTESSLNEAMRFGTRRNYRADELGRYGLGLKTASLSQCRRLTVLSRHSTVQRRITARTLDLDLVDRTDAWVVVEPDASPSVGYGLTQLEAEPGTVVLWDDLDRLLGPYPDSGYARRRLATAATRCASYLAMVFHRQLEGDAVTPLTIIVDGMKIEPWNPYAPDESDTRELDSHEFELDTGNEVDTVRLTGWILPARRRFSSPERFERLAGPLKWNRQQGFYVYRNNRLIQAGGWAGLRAIDEHTKLARVALDFSSSLDELFAVNVAKMRVNIPAELRPMLARPVNDICAAAQRAYRVDGVEKTDSRGGEAAAGPTAASRETGLALWAAAVESGDVAALDRIIGSLRRRHPTLAEQLGF